MFLNFKFQLLIKRGVNRVAGIPGPIIFITGIIVSVVSFFFNKKSLDFNSAYALFLYFGLILVLYGFVKILIWYITQKSEEEKKEAVKQALDKTAKANQPLQNNIQQNQNIQNGERSDIMQTRGDDEDRYTYVLKCKSCGISYFSYANFCQNCGLRLK